MSLDAWLPVNHELPDSTKLMGVAYGSEDWQIYKAKGNRNSLVVKDSLAKKWLERGLIDAGMFEAFTFGKEKFHSLTSESRHNLIPVVEGKSPRSKNEAVAFSLAMKISRERDKESGFQDAIYIEKISRLLPTYSLTNFVSDDVVLGFYLTGGVPVSVTSSRRIRSLTSWLSPDQLHEVILKSGVAVSIKAILGDEPNNRSKGKFTLPGRKDLEQFLCDHVIDIVENPARYKALGIESPSAIILHGPPGCGKTFAIEQLVEHLEWPCYNIEASSVASPYIHETSKKVAEVFEKAIQNSPAVIVIDEMEAFLTNRQSSSSSGQHHVEEVAEFLRRIPEAIKQGVLVVGMTNQIDLIDPAILRRGRFDHVIKVDMASQDEVEALLHKLVDKLPQEGTIDVTILAEQLGGRPLSDVAYIVREAARLAARAGKDKLNQEFLVQALENSPARNAEPPRRKIGFM
jgi:cell division protease FtsH